MNYVGQLAGQVFVTVKELYKGLNPATLSGCIDIIVVRQPDGNLQCSPFHVRFGKMGVLRSREKVVDIEINGEAVDLHMKLGDNGEAFFVQEMDNDKEVIPYHLSTSPILSEGTALMETQLKRNSTDRIRNLDSSVSSQVPPQGHGSQPAIETSLACSSVKKRRKKRRKSTHKMDSLKREDNGDTSEDEDMFPIEISSEEEKEPLDNSRIPVPEVCIDEVSEIKTPAVATFSQSASYPHSDGEWSPLQSPSGSRPPTPKSDSELVSKPMDRGGLKNNPQMHWAWGELPQAAKATSLLKAKEPSVVDVNPSESTHFRVIQSAPIEEFNTVSPLPALGQADVATADETEPLSAETSKPETQSPVAAVPPLPANEEIKQAAACSAQPVGKTDSPSRRKGSRTHCGTNLSWTRDASELGILKSGKATSLLKAKEPSVVDVNPSESTHFRVIQSAPIEEFNTVSPLPALGQADVATADETEPLSAETSKPETESPVAAVPPLPANEEIKQAAACSAQPVGKTDSPSRRKDKRSRHLGADGVYLDDLTDMDPEVAALYFPKNGDDVQSKNTTDNGPRSASQSPQSFGSSGVDSGVESVSDGIRDLPSIAVSLCGGLTDNKEITKEEFLEHAVTYQQFVDNPAIIDDPNLVVKIGNKYYNWTTAGPLLLAMQAFQKPLPKATVESIMRDKMPKKGGRWWFSWRGRNSTIKEETKPEQGMSGSGLTGDSSSQMMANRIKDESSSSDEDPRSAKQNLESLQTSSSHLSLLSGVSYKKTLRLTSDQLKNLKLKNGPNDVTFSVTTQYQGTCRCEGTIYLWNWDDKVIISDIDGTITRSDTLGHILPTLGKDWTHQGIAKLYHKKNLKLKNGPNDVTFSVTTQYQGTCRCEGTIYLWNWDDKVIISDIDGTITRSDTLGHILPTLGKDWTHQGIAKLYHKEKKRSNRTNIRGVLVWECLYVKKKPEKFKVQCLTDIKNLFYPNTEPFYAAFGNRPADVYSYKQVGVSLNRIFTVNPKGELIQEHAKTNISSYVRLCEVVDHIFPLLKRSHSSDFPCSDTFSQFTYWREPLPPFETQDIHPASS
nr:PREDICTED: phosphatidate phosphatase LPIN1 [Apteryx mantelli mantelli]